MDIRISPRSGEFTVEATPENKNLTAMKAHGQWFFVLAEAAKISRHYGLSPKVLAPERITRDMLAELEFGYNSMQSKAVRYPSINVLSETISDACVTIDAAIKENGELVAKYTGAFPCIIRVFEAEKSIGLLEIETTRCRITPGELNRPGYVHAFKLERYPNGKLTMRVRIDGVDDSTTGFAPGSFELETKDEGKLPGR